MPLHLSTPAIPAAPQLTTLALLRHAHSLAVLTGILLLRLHLVIALYGISITRWRASLAAPRA